jgi:hypothetical protein
MSEVHGGSTDAAGREGLLDLGTQGDRGDPGTEGEETRVTHPVEGQ